MTCWSMNSSTRRCYAPVSVAGSVRASADGLAPEGSAHPLVHVQDVDRDQDRQQRRPGHPAAEHVERVVEVQVDPDDADGHDQHGRDRVGGHPLPPVRREARHAEGDHPVEHHRPQGVARREDGDVIEADVVHVEHGREQLGQGDGRDGDEVLQRPLHREGEGAQRRGAGPGRDGPCTARTARRTRSPGPRTSRSRGALIAVRAESTTGRCCSIQAWSGCMTLPISQPSTPRYSVVRFRATSQNRVGSRIRVEQERGGRARDRAAQLVLRAGADDEATRGVRNPPHDP